MFYALGVGRWSRQVRSVRKMIVTENTEFCAFSPINIPPGYLVKGVCLLSPAHTPCEPSMNPALQMIQASNLYQFVLQ
jgi:hypothetical protein